MCYECLNPDCFYNGSLLGVEDVNLEHYWDSTIEDLGLRATCPSCGEPMAIWDESPDSEVKDGAIQKKFA